MRHWTLLGWVGFVVGILVVVVAALVWPGPVLVENYRQNQIIRAMVAQAQTSQPTTQVVQQQPTAMMQPTATPTSAPTKVPTKAPTSAPTKVPTQTTMVSPSATATSVLSPTSAIAASSIASMVTMTSTAVVSGTVGIASCRHELWLSEAISDTVGVSELVAVLDRDFVPGEGGQWSEAGFTVLAGSIFWTDLFQNVSNLLTGVQVVRVQGGWGVYRTSVQYIVPKPNGGGRFMQICEWQTAPVVSTATPVPTTVPPVTTPSVTPATSTCISGLEVNTITNASDPGKEYDRFFEGKGYIYGKSFRPGETVDAGWLVHANAAVFVTKVQQKLDNGGRGMPICK